jgi:hypothetical protein
MSCTIVDPRTGMRVTLAIFRKPEREWRARHWVLRELDRLADQRKQPNIRSS